MTPFVLDASVALAWCFEDEASRASRALLDRLERGGAVVPQIWTLEVANILLGAERRGRMTPARVTMFLDLLDALPIEVDPETAARGFRDVIPVARQYHLTSYDGAYLELAMRRALPLATRDDALVKAARAAGVTLLRS